MDKYLMLIEQKKEELKQLEEEVQELEKLASALELEVNEINKKTNNLILHIESLERHKIKMEDAPKELRKCISHALYGFFLLSALAVAFNFGPLCGNLTSLLSSEFLIKAGLTCAGMSTGFYFFEKWVWKSHIFDGKSLNGIRLEIAEEMQKKNEKEDELTLAKEKSDNMCQQWNDKKEEYKSVKLEINGIEEKRNNAINQILGDLLEQQLNEVDSSKITPTTETKPFMMKKTFEQR